MFGLRARAAIVGNGTTKCTLARMSQIPVTKSGMLRPFFASTVALSDDERSRMARDNAAILRAMRNGKNVDDMSASADDDRIDLRYRKRTDGKNNNGPSPLDLWGSGAVKAEQKRQKQNNSKARDQTLLSILADEDIKNEMTGRSFSNEPTAGTAILEGVGRKGRNSGRFVSFFDEVDDLVEKRRNQFKAKRSGAGGLNLATLLDKLDNYPDGSATSNRPNSQYSSLENSQGATSIFSSDSSFASTMASPTNVRSIFDTIPKPQEPVQNPNMYDKEIFAQYSKMMRDELESPRFLEKATKGMDEGEREEILRPVFRWLLKHERALSYDLPTLQRAVDTVNDDDKSEIDMNTFGDEFRDQMDKQRQRFLDETGLSFEQHEIGQSILHKFAGSCAKRARAAPVEVAWEKIKEAGVILGSDTMSTLLYVVGMGGSSFSSFAHRMSNRRPASKLSIESLFTTRTSNLFESPKDEDEEDDKDSESDSYIDVPEEIAVCHDLLYEPTENSTSLRVKSLISKGDAAAAEALLEKFASNDGTVRLRSYLPILRLYCEKGDVSSALALFKRMRNVPTVYLEPENYVLLLSALAAKGCFNKDGEPIECATELGYSSSCGSYLFDELVTEMAEDVLEITSASARKLYNSFATGMKDSHPGRNLKQMHSLAGMMAFNEEADIDELVASRITVDHETGLCPRTKATLRLVMLEDDQRKQLIKSLHQLSESEAVKFSRGNKKANAERAAEELTRFATWLDTRTGEPFTAIVDGANVAYFMQNFDSGRFNYHQIQFVVDALIKVGEKPLVILPYKYGFDSFTVTTGVSGVLQELTEKERNVRDNLLRKGMMYRVPPRCLDDYYWMLASVSDQTVSRNGKNLDVAPQNEEGRWPGTRPILLSNDQMRDHKLELLEPRLFRRWHSSHIVNYNFTAFVDDECVDNEIGFSTPDFFSREIQGNPDPSGGTAWHFPVSDWDLDDRFVIRIPP